MAFKSQNNMTEMPGKESSENAFQKWTAKLHRAFKPILSGICSDTYTMFKIEHPTVMECVTSSGSDGMTRTTNATMTPKENLQRSKTPRLMVMNRRRRNQRKTKERKKIRRQICSNM